MKRQSQPIQFFSIIIIFSLLLPGSLVSNDSFVVHHLKQTYNKVKSRLDLYARCIRGKCNPEEQKIFKDDIRKADLISGLIVLIILIYGIKSRVGMINEIISRYPFPPLSPQAEKIRDLFVGHYLAPLVLRDDGIKRNLNLIFFEKQIQRGDTIAVIEKQLQENPHQIRNLSAGFLHLLAHLYYKKYASADQYQSFLTKFNLFENDQGINSWEFSQYASREIPKTVFAYDDFKKIVNDKNLKEYFSHVVGSRKVQWWHVLGFSAKPTFKEAKKAYQKLALTFHPDKGGDADLFFYIQKAFEQADKELPK